MLQVFYILFQKSKMNQAPTCGPASKVELHIECQHLIKKDSTSKSDPCVAFFMFQQGTWNEVNYVQVVFDTCTTNVY